MFRWVIPSVVLMFFIGCGVKGPPVPYIELEKKKAENNTPTDTKKPEKK